MDAERVGSLPEEAAKLIAVLQGWAGDHAASRPGPAASSSPGDEPRTTTADGDSDPGPEPPAGHDPLSPECRYCLWCQAVRTARATTPEVREHLASAAVSFALALQGLLETTTERSARRQSESPLEKIDLAED